MKRLSRPAKPSHDPVERAQPPGPPKGPEGSASVPKQEPALVAWNRAWTLKGNAAAALPPLAREFFALGRIAVRPESTPGEMHRFRLQTKRFRYVLELFVPVYGEAMEARLKSLKTIQNCLGELNDRDTVRLLLESYQKVVGRKRLFALLAADTHRLSTAFRRLWDETIDSPGQEEDWMEFLADPGARVRTSSQVAGRRRARQKL